MERSSGHACIALPLRKGEPEEAAIRGGPAVHRYPLYSGASDCQPQVMRSLREDVLAILRRHRMVLSPALGQHFLVDECVLRDVIAAAAIQTNDRVVEIGAGLGILTHALLQVGARVTAIEVDRRWIPLLEEFVGPDSCGSGRLSILRGNALRVSYPEEPYSVVANIPYYLSSHLLKHLLLKIPHRPTSLTLLLQREVAQKCVTQDDRTMLTLLIGLFAKAQIIRAVPPGAFLPSPEVESSLIRFDCFREPLADRETIQTVLRIAARAFGRKRKMLRTSIGKFGRGMEWLENTGIDPARRPQTLTAEEWVRLARAATEE